MKVFASLFLLFFLANPDLTEIRTLYKKASDSEANAKELNAKLESVSENGDKTLVAYKGAGITLKSKFSGNLPDKISFFKEGARLVDGAIAAEPKNIEIRMIRLSIQESVPRIVNYRKNKKEDKAFILANYNAQTGALKDYIKNFILQSPSFTAAQKAAVK